MGVFGAWGEGGGEKIKYSLFGHFQGDRFWSCSDPPLVATLFTASRDPV